MQMRVMEDLLDEAGMTDEYRVQTMLELDNQPFCLGFDDGSGGMDEQSDEEDPEVALRCENEQLRREAADQQAFVAAVQDLRSHDVLRQENERLRMQLEDHR